MPIIGVTPVSNQTLKEYRIRFDYPELIQKAGGTPLLLPLSDNEADWERYLSLCDGLLFTGGDDLSSAYYGEKRHPQTDQADQTRDKMEMFLMKAAHERDIPVFGICRGCQLMNVACGGDLYQDIPSMLPGYLQHRMEEPYQRFVHRVAFPENSVIRKILHKNHMEVNSIHHQGIRKLGDGLQVMAYASDGLIEAVADLRLRCFMAVQWHPEFVFRQDEDSVKLLRYFIEKCEE